MSRDLQVNLRLSEEARSVLATAASEYGLAMSRFASEAIVAYAAAYPHIAEAARHAPRRTSPVSAPKPGMGANQYTKRDSMR